MSDGTALYIGAMKQNTIVSSTRPRGPKYALSPRLDWSLWAFCTLTLLVTSCVRTPWWLQAILSIGLVIAACWLLLTVRDMRASRQGRYRDVSNIKAPLFIRL